MSQQLTRFDDMIFAICKETGGIEGLFNTVFSFLFRRTDFYYESDPGDKMGFPPGVNIKIVQNVFENYQKEYYKKNPKKSPQEFKEKLQKFKEQQQLEQSQQNQNQLQTSSIPATSKKQEISQQTDKSQQKTTSVQNDNNNSKQNQEKNINLSTNNNKTEKNVEKQQEEASQDQKLKENIQQVQQNESQDDKQKKSDGFSTYNGGVTDKYSWSQNINDVTVQITLPNFTKPKDLNVELKNKSIKIQLKKDNQVLIQGDLFHSIKVEDSIWSIEDGKKLILTLEKQEENIWKTIVKGDAEIDATKVDNQKPLEDFDQETQGLPTTEEEKQHEMLQKAWNAEGSPFKGQPFDPSKFNLQGGQNFNPSMMDDQD